MYEIVIKRNNHTINVRNIARDVSIDTIERNIRIVSQGKRGLQGVPGEDGEPGEPGQDGVGVPTGGTIGQILAKNSNDPFDTEWVNPPSSAVWGSITGNIADQTDLITYLDTNYYTASEINIIFDDYYTQTQIDTLLDSYLDITGGDARYLKLDASNDPITAGLSIAGSANEVQLSVKGHTTQTANYFAIRNSSNIDLIAVDTSGHLTLANNTNNTPSLRFAPTSPNVPLYIYQRNLALTMGLNGNNVNRILAWFPLQGVDLVWSMELQVYGNNSSFYPLFPSVSVTNTIGRSGNRWNNVYSWRATIDQLTMGYNGDQSPAINMILQSGQSANPLSIKNSSSADLAFITALGGAVFNEQGDPSADFRVESDSYDALFIDSSNDSIAVMNNAGGKVTFYGGTPVVQQVLATGAGATVDNVISFLQTINLVKQS